MYCEHCGTDGECAVCGGRQDADDYDRQQKRIYSAAVAGCCVAGVVICLAVAGICAAVNVLGGAK